MITVTTNAQVLRLDWEHEGRRAGIKYAKHRTGTPGFYLTLREGGRTHLRRYEEIEPAIERGNAFLSGVFDIPSVASTS